MKAYELMNAIIQSTDLLYSGQQLIEFANAVYKEKNRATMIKVFYENLYLWVSSYMMGNKLFERQKNNYFICEESKAALMYLALRIPAKKTPIKSINEIRAMGEYILSHYIQPVGKCISVSSLNNILKHLDENYSFSTKIFPNGKTYFIRMPYSHKEFNSECLTTINKEGVIIPHFFLYHMKEKGPDAPNPEAVLFHELGHAIHARCFGDVTKVPDNVIDILQEICFPHLKQSESAEQSEVFADVLSVGLMYQTPYEKYDLCKNVHPDAKMAFKMLVENMLKNILI